MLAQKGNSYRYHQSDPLHKALSESQQQKIISLTGKVRRRTEDADINQSPLRSVVRFIKKRILDFISEVLSNWLKMLDAEGNGKKGKAICN